MLSKQLQDEFVAVGFRVVKFIFLVPVVPFWAVASSGIFTWHSHPHLLRKKTSLLNVLGEYIVTKRSYLGELTENSSTKLS